MTPPFKQQLFRHLFGAAIGFVFAASLWDQSSAIEIELYRSVILVIGSSKLGNLLLSAQGPSRVRIAIGAALASLLYLGIMLFGEQPLTFLQHFGMLPEALLIGGYIGYFVRLVLFGGLAGIILGVLVASIVGDHYVETIVASGILAALLFAATGEIVGDKRLPRWLRVIPRAGSEAE